MSYCDPMMSVQVRIQRGHQGVWNHISMHIGPNLCILGINDKYHGQFDILQVLSKSRF